MSSPPDRSDSVEMDRQIHGDHACEPAGMFDRAMGRALSTPGSQRVGVKPGAREDFALSPSATHDPRERFRIAPPPPLPPYSLPHYVSLQAHSACAPPPPRAAGATAP